MPPWVLQLCEGFTSRWTNATPADYGRLLVAIVLAGWFLTRRHLFNN